jgi:excisionase family DNA binding protein
MTQHRMTVHDAARRLGISEDAVRMRVKRGTLEAEREGGRLYVLLTPDPTSEPTDRTNELITELRDRVRSLEEQMQEERAANRENRRIIAALTQRIPELPPSSVSAVSQEPSESPSEATEQPGRVEPQPAVEGAQEPTEPRSWWRRVFGG